MTGDVISRRKFLKRLMIGGVSVIAASYPTLIERYSVQKNTYEIPVRNLPEAFTGFTIIHISDLHYGWAISKQIVRDVIDDVNQMERDIIVNTGDNVFHSRESQVVDEVWPLLMKLTAPMGVYAVLGNNDHWGHTLKSLDWMEKSGQGIRHRSVALEKNGSRIWLGGAGDFLEDTDGVDVAFSGVPQEDCKILLAHNPDTADVDFTTRVDLVLSGHTHGGQVILPVVGPLVLPVENKRYSSGFIRTPRTNLFISRGIGTTIPVRFNCYPEIAILKLVPDV